VLRRLYRSFLLFALCSTATWCQGTDAVIVEHDVAMKTRDGVTLRADLYRPAGDGKYPVLLQRTPYEKRSDAEFARQAAAHGFLLVLQDVRGRFASGGEWYPFRHEMEDGYDAVEWAAALPHSNGQVGMFGGSYVGATQMLAAVSRPPHLAGICPVVTASNYHENWVYQGGAFVQAFDQSWTSGLIENTLVRQLRKATNPELGRKVLPLLQYPLLNEKVEVSPQDAAEKLAPYFLDWLAHPEYDSYWKQWAIDERYAKIDVPALTVAAWYDLFQGGSLKNYEGLRLYSGKRDKQRLMITLGGHAGTGRKIGDVDFGPDAPVNYNEIALAWYEYLLQGKQNEFATSLPVKIFVMGKNVWRAESSWPLKRARSTRYYLHSSGKANSAAGDGGLSLALPGKEAADSYVYDPADPVPTVGGPLCCETAGHMPGPADQQEIEKRNDVLVYTTPVLERDLEVTGPVKLDLFVQSSAVDTDFTAKLVDVWPNGFAQNLTEGILRARYRESTAYATPLVPGQTYQLTIDLWSTSNVFLKGHKIRVEISSSNFPRFDRNLNTGKSANTESVFQKTTNTILHNAEYPSAIVLPLVPDEGK